MKRQNQIKDLSRLNYENFENMFNVYQTEDGLYYYNLVQNIIFPQNLPKTLFNKYVISYGDTWPLVSFKTLKTPNLWWVILLANGIRNPITTCEVGKEINIPIDEVIREVLNQISS